MRIMVLKGTHYFPRGKYKGGPKEPSWSKHERPPLQYEITKERLQATLLLPRMEAAASLGIKGSSIFTRVHHELGVQDWPTRNEVLTKKGESPWTKEDDKNVVKLVSRFGVTVWAEIAGHLPGRSRKQV